MKSNKIILASLLWLLLTAPLPALELAESAIDDVELKQQNGCYWIELRFEQPVHYLSHFPYSAGDAVRINIREINRAVQYEPRFSLTEHPGFQPQPPFTLLDIGYTPGMVELRFATSTRFAIWPGPNSRSLIVSVPGPDGDTPCGHHN